MKTLAIPALTLSLVLASPAFAVDGHHPDQAGPAAAAPAQMGALAEKMRDNAKKMASQADRIANAKSDEERRAALSEHMQTMQENMRMARGMNHTAMGSQMMPGSPPMMQGGDQGVADRMRDMKPCMEMMEQMMGRGDHAAMKSCGSSCSDKSVDQWDESVWGDP